MSGARSLAAVRHPAQSLATARRTLCSPRMRLFPTSATESLPVTQC